MDGATHFLIPYAAALLALGAWRSNAPRHRITWAVAFGIGGWAPDFDVAVDWLTKPFPQLYFFQHRGLSHSLVGAPLFALAVMALLALIATRWRRIDRLHWNQGAVIAAMLGSLTHLILDGVTYGGVPMFWPFANGRVMWPVFAWLVIWLFPVGLVAIAVHLWGKLDRRAMAGIGCAFIVILLVLGSVRLSSQPPTPAGGVVYSRETGEWMVLSPVAGGWHADMLSGGLIITNKTYLEDAPAQAGDAVEAARQTPEFKGFELGLFGPLIVQAKAQGAGWNVTFIAVAQRFDAENHPRWTPAEPKDSWGLCSFLVDAQGHAVNTARGW